MNLTSFQRRLADFHPQRYPLTRSLALYSAAIAVADEKLLDQTIHIGRTHGLGREKFHEIVLQSYLFLGFPRMLTAAEHLTRLLPAANESFAFRQISQEESEQWFTNGLQLCRAVYGDGYGRLKEKVEGMAPDVFRWMVIEGYGKVLSRPQLGIVDREVAIISCLIVENRARQLFSHIRGAVNVGASSDLIRDVIDDLGDADGPGYNAARSMFGKLGLV
ncbi:MAG TPA: carboxymuconolactone decarboxylase family protein [Candidatus Deferrimicrobium sp.]|nr:carboxymuconolactone decarboxylase family protein [Candidatus Deferrimicrobium sp.]